MGVSATDWLRTPLPDGATHDRFVRLDQSKPSNPYDRCPIQVESGRPRGDCLIISSDHGGHSQTRPNFVANRIRDGRRKASGVCGLRPLTCAILIRGRVCFCSAGSGNKVRFVEA